MLWLGPAMLRLGSAMLRLGSPMLWLGPTVPSGSIWEHLGAYGSIWGHMGACWIIWDDLGDPGCICETVLYHRLTASRSIYLQLEGVSRSW